MIPIRVGMIPLVTGFLTFTQATVAVVGAMVLMVVTSALLETHTPAPRARSTRLSLPRRVKGSADTLPKLDPYSVRAEYDRQLAEELAPKPMMLVRPGVDGPQPVAPVGVPEPTVEPETGPPTEQLPIVVTPAWATHDHFAPAARTAVRSAVAHRMAPPVPWLPAEFEWGLADADVLERETTVEAALEVALDRLEQLSLAEASLAPVSPVRPTPSTVFVARAEDGEVPPVELGEQGADRELAGVLFAAYVASGMPERNRVTGWVAPLAAPPSLPDLVPDERLRGRPGRVTALLGCEDDGRNWITLDERTDISRGLTRRPPTDDDLKGVVWWWFLATDERARIPSEHVPVMRRGLEAVAPELEGHPRSPTVAALIEMAGAAEHLGVGVRIESVSAAALAPPAAVEASVAVAI